MTDISRNDSTPAEPDAPREDTATSWPEGERLDPRTSEPIEVNADERRAANRPEHNSDGTRHENA